MTRTLATLVLVCGSAALAGCGPTPLGPGEGISDSFCSQSGTLCTVLGTGAHGYNGEGNAPLDTNLFYPSAVRFFPDGSPLVVDFNNMRLVTFDNEVAHLAGRGWHAGAVDGIEATESALENPIDGAVLPDGSFLIAEYHTGRVLHVDATGWLTVLAGTGQIGFAGDGGPARQAVLSEFAGLTTAPDGTIYIADTQNHCIRAIDPVSGVIDMVAGDGEPGNADGALDQARFNEPWHLAWHDDALYVADRYNHEIRRIDLLTEEVTTVAGTGVPGTDGDGGPALEAQLNLPSAVTVDEDGALWIADRQNHAIRRIDPDGTLTTPIGYLGVAGDGPDAGPVGQSALQSPENVAIHPDTGALWITDSHNSKIRVYVP